LFEPFAVFLTFWFYERRDVQPIKARSPVLVVWTDIVLILYSFSLCMQRIFDTSFPCELTLWCAYIGTVFLANTYLWRCWTLFFTFHLTQQKLKDQSMRDLPFFIRNRHYISTPFLAKIFLILLLLSCIPPLILQATTTIQEQSDTDTCDLSWGRYPLIGYLVLYCVVFLFFAYNLRSVVDGFQIKNELKFSGVTVIISIVPWAVFNEDPTLGSNFNSDVFPVSTFSLLVAITCLFGASTIWPLFRSIYKPPTIRTDIPDNLDVLSSLISTKEGFDSFRKFLTAEFSVENLLFYSEVEELRGKIRESPIDFLKGESQRLFAKYIVMDSPFQVNLPDAIVQTLDAKMTLYQKEGIIEQRDEVYRRDVSGRLIENPTVFDEAQRSIYNLMDSDSFPRYKSSAMYMRFVEMIKQQRHKNTVLKEMDII